MLRIPQPVVRMWTTHELSCSEQITNRFSCPSATVTDLFCAQAL